MSQTIEVELTSSPVELYKVLKFEGIAASGAEAKLFIEQGLVSVNGELETRKRRKIIPGDEIDFEDITLVITE
ncbi:MULTISPECIES: RNA-binding S4 domain-containing protein [Methylophaga]|jgi:ribosome-associated protein|uniref:RNA-binding S4 domain-containing protein n=1 Tax=Methylophaga marina TaxID=45495 RepID=A0ABP3D3R0_9GAMM|nr:MULTISPECIES: RNA-binding S4 domain-containing protein [Methylophaga]BDZ75175.1 S4 RNA-binding domain protein [Methylophaga marina]|tara:strand:- start:4206 stop:4424 length:219 start_codon:yes stop_codon:yes gene_type:complete